MRQNDKQVAGGEDLWNAGELMRFYRNPQSALSPHRVSLWLPLSFLSTSTDTVSGLESGNAVLRDPR